MEDKKITYLNDEDERLDYIIEKSIEIIESE